MSWKTEVQVQNVQGAAQRSARSVAGPRLNNPRSCCINLTVIAVADKSNALISLAPLTPAAAAFFYLAGRFAVVADPSMYAPLPPLFSQTMRGLSHPLCPPLPPKQHALNLKNLIEKSGATRCGSSQPPADCCLSAAAQRIARVLEVFCSRYAGPRGGDAAPHDECDARLARSVCCSKAVDACGRRGDGVSCEACCSCG